MTCLCDNPWLFHRDEIDLLEEEIDEIYRQYDSDEADAHDKMETLVLQEQWETEEQSDKELSFLVGPEQTFFPESAHEDTTDIHLPCERDPLYEEIYLWANRVFAYTTKRYVKEGVRDEDVFRAHVNVKMIPIKFVATQSEDVADHPIAKQIADTERHLCFTYFTRTLDSLEHRLFLGDEEAAPLVREGKELERLVRSHL